MLAFVLGEDEAAGLKELALDICPESCQTVGV